MVRDSRIKQTAFSATISAAGELARNYSDAINGEVLEVDYTWNLAGSLWLAVSGTNSEVWRRNAASGASTLTSYPRVFGESTTGSIAGADLIPRVVNGPVYLAGSGLASGTAPLSVVVRYR